MSHPNTTDKPRIVRMAEASAHLLVARDALSKAEVALHSAVNAEDDPAWGIASRAAALRADVETQRTAAFELMWRH